MGTNFENLIRYGAPHRVTVTVQQGLFTLARDVACEAQATPRHWKKVTIRTAPWPVRTIAYVPGTARFDVPLETQPAGPFSKTVDATVAMWERLFDQPHDASIDVDRSGPKRAEFGEWTEEPPASDRFTLRIGSYVVHAEFGPVLPHQ